MSIVATLVNQGKNRLRFLLVCNTTGTTTGALTYISLVTNYTLGETGPIRRIVNQFTQGYGTLPPGNVTQAQSRGLWMNDNTGGAGPGNVNIPRAQPVVTYRTGAAEWLVDGDIDTAGGNNHPIIVLSANNVGSAYLDIESPGLVGV